ncbi:hypothetical protein [Nonomuraea sp. NPDC050786]|uniref:hypothetical protein n=1 Tax=Nonomuraea sp. NPDC050786 TaxID=3154840 RepID=UPI0033F057F1
MFQPAGNGQGGQGRRRAPADPGGPPAQGGPGFPDGPGVPDSPGGPGGPGFFGAPDGPSGPGFFGGPDGPGGPGGPGGPTAPGEPGAPGGPDAPGASDADAPKGGRRSRRGRAADDSDQPDKPDKTDKKADKADKASKGKSERAPQSRVGWSPYDEGPRSRAPLWFSLGGLAVLGLLGGGLALMFNADDPATTQASVPTRTSAPLPSAPPGKYGFAAERSSDPEPITVKEIFGKQKKITVAGRSYEMTITSKDKKCSDGALGDALKKALKAGKCTQLVRASFRDKAGKVIGTIGVANLKSSKSASKVAKVGSTSNYVKPLAGKDSVTKQLGSGAGGARIWTHGHYAIMVWFQNKDGTKPDKKGSKQLFAAIDDITKATVFKALDNRSLTGSPQ